MNLTSGNPDEIVESWYFNDETYEKYDHLNFNLLNSHLVTVRELFKDNIDKSKLHIQQEWPSNLIKWTIYIRNGTFRLQVFKNNGDFICEKVESWDYSASLIEKLIMPHYSPFVKTISRDIYKTWSGETLINFKWNKYGKYYYSIIWIGFMFLLGCFTAAATIPQQYINDDIQKQLLIASIILGFIHLSFEIRQIIYDPIKWISDIWNIFGM
uniref:Uncharacterized protein n=1 Tax=Rhizophagus irregularis (strain DAOM 181602 / DAOM 197198 / MUCL 43194) TaxID=747089 RepID=U9SRE4_RHIID